MPTDRLNKLTDQLEDALTASPHLTQRSYDNSMLHAKEDPMSLDGKETHHLDSDVNSNHPERSPKPWEALPNRGGRLTPQEKGLTAATLHAQTKRRLDSLESRWDAACEGCRVVREYAGLFFHIWQPNLITTFIIRFGRCD